MRGTGLVLIHLFLVVGCRASVRKTFSEMKSAACASDVNAFFEHVDPQLLSENLGQPLIRRALFEDDVEPRSRFPWPQQSPGVWDFASAVHRMTQICRDEVLKGALGQFCKMKIEAIYERPGISEVRWGTTSGQQILWTFQLQDNNWRLIDFQHPDRLQPRLRAD